MCRGLACGLASHKFHKPSIGLKCISNTLNNLYTLCSYSDHIVFGDQGHNGCIVTLTSKVDMVHHLIMVNMFAKFNIDAHNGLVSFLFTGSKYDEYTDICMHG